MCYSNNASGSGSRAAYRSRIVFLFTSRLLPTFSELDDLSAAGNASLMDVQLYSSVNIRRVCRLLYTARYACSK